jgi:RecB family exonuclease
VLASPLFDFGGGPIASRTVGEFDAFLARAQYFADRERLAILASAFADEPEAEPPPGAGRGREPDGVDGASRGALSAAVSVVLASLPELDPPRRMSEYLEALRDFAERFERYAAAPGADPGRHLRARRALLDALGAMRRACLAHDDPALPFRDVVAIVRRWIESQTFSPRIGRDGVRVLDATSARFADVDAMWLAGLLEGEWPPPHGRMTFYSTDLLADLGWPGDRLRLLAERAMFDDLLRAARSQVAMTTVSLEDEAVTRPSIYLDDLDVGAFPLVRVSFAGGPRVSVADAVLSDPIAPAAFSGAAREWLEWRMARGGIDAPRFHGAVGPFVRDRHTVTALETYLECPFKYFARHVLGLDEPEDENDGLSPKESGRLLHLALERFIVRFDAARITADDPAAIGRARDLFAETVDEVLAGVAERDRAIERTRLLGSALAIGAGERVLSLEFERDDALVERRLESSFDRGVALEAGDRARTVRLRGKIDRVDVFADRTFRVVDYKRGNSAPSGSKALQLPIYALAVEQASRDAGTPLTVRDALYMALGPRGSESRVIKPGTRADAIGGAQARLLAAVDGLERGEFPPRPRETHLCTRCGFAIVCRKDYVSDGEAAQA